MKKAFLLFLAVLLSAAGAANAETIRIKSKVAGVNTATNYLKLYRLNDQTEKIEEIKVDCDRNTQFYGADSLRDISDGDEVAVQANHTAYSNEWKALEVKLTLKRSPRRFYGPSGPLPSAPLMSSGTRLLQNEVEEAPAQTRGANSVLKS